MTILKAGTSGLNIIDALSLLLNIDRGDMNKERFTGAIMMLLSIIMTASISLYISSKIFDFTNVNIQITVSKKIADD